MAENLVPLDYVDLFQNLKCRECALVNSQTANRSCIHQYHKMLPDSSFCYVKLQIQRGMSMGLKHCKTIVWQGFKNDDLLNVKAGSILQ